LKIRDQNQRSQKANSTGKTCANHSIALALMTMITRSSIFGLVTLGSLLLTGGFALEASTIQGDGKGPDGKPITGAEVQIARVNAKQVLQRAKTDKGGHYVFEGVPSGVSFRVVAWVNRVPNAVDNVRTRDEGAVRVDFDIKATAAKAVSEKKAKHFVWIPPATGTNLGGRWVEVDDSGQPKSKSDNLDQVSGQGLRNAQQRLNPVGPGSR